MSTICLTVIGYAMSKGNDELETILKEAVVDYSEILSIPVFAYRTEVSP
jgi:hypothetical protein